jgi:hypothetical protein
LGNGGERGTTQYWIGICVENQQECNWREMLRLVKERCNDIEGQNMLAKFPDKSSLTQYRELKFSLGQKVIHRMLFKKTKELNSVANSRDMATERS